MHQWVLNVAVLWLALLFIGTVNNISVIYPCHKDGDTNDRLRL